MPQALKMCVGCLTPNGCSNCLGLHEWIMEHLDSEPVVYGRWIMRGGKRYCSVCGDRACVTRDTDDFWYTEGTKYCPNCGSKMEAYNGDS